jgi:polysaccharide export outer membrane protein
VVVLAGSFLGSCRSYKQNILFQVSPAEAQKQRIEAETNYVIARNDLLTLKVYTNQGERIVDPNLESFKEENANSTAGGQTPAYIVDLQGTVKFPLLTQLKVEGLTIRQAEEVLEKEYGRFYQQPFVVLGFNNKRVIVLGAPGGQVIPLTNENMRLTEVLALAKGITIDARANNIRIIRDSQVLVSDLTKFEAYAANDIIVRPGDIVYVEPIRRPFTEAIRDFSPVISLVTSLATLVFIISQVK